MCFLINIFNQNEPKKISISKQDFIFSINLLKFKNILK